MNDNPRIRPKTEPDGLDVIQDIHTRRELAVYRLLADVTVAEIHRRAHVFFMAAFFAAGAALTCMSLVGQVPSPFPVAAAAVVWGIVAVLTTLSGVWALRTSRLVSEGRELEFRFHEDRLDRIDYAAGILPPTILHGDHTRAMDNDAASKRRKPWWKRLNSTQVTYEAGFFVFILAAAWAIVMTGQSTWPTMAISLVIAYILRFTVLPALERRVLRRWPTRKTTDTPQDSPGTV